MKKKRAAAKGKFIRKAYSFRKVYSDEAPVTVLEGIYEEVEVAFKGVESLNEDYTDLLYKQKEGTVMDEANEYISVVETHKVELKIELEKAKLAQSQVAQSENVVTPRLSVKKLDPSTFSGDMRDFPNFKNDYERLVVWTFGQDPYALRQCLSGEAAQSVKGLEDDYSAMFERLNKNMAITDK